MKTRRDILLSGAALAATLTLPRSGLATPSPAGAWRRFDVVTKLEVATATGRTQAWIPMAAFFAEDWIRVEDNTWQTNAASAKVVEDPTYGAKMLHAVWDEGTASPFVTLTSRFATRDRRNDFSSRGNVAPLTDEERRLYLSPTALMPIDGAVKALSDRITAGAESEIGRARAIYEWMVENTFRRGSTRGCGEGDVAAMVSSNDFGGKCADLNGLFVALARAAGLPARDIYGVRVAPSKLGYRSLGANSTTITKAQHCRAEVYLTGHGWVAMDPADVRKVMLEEQTGGLPIDAPQVIAARKMLFGSWEGNWLPYNTAHDLVLPGASSVPLGFLMYPQVETAAGHLDCLQPETVKYDITAAEISI